MKFQTQAKKLVSLLLSFLMIISVFTALPFTAGAVNTDAKAIEVSGNVNDSDISTFATEPETDESNPVATNNTLVTVDSPLMVATTKKSSEYLNNDYVSFANINAVTPEGEYYTRGEWLHNLNVVFNFTVESGEEMPDNYFSDLSTTDTYYKDVLLAVEFGVVECEAGGEVRPNDYATRDFVASTLNFCLGYQLSEETYTYSDVAETEHPNDAQIAINHGWLATVDGKFNPDSYVTMLEADAMLQDAKTVLEESEIDESHNDIFKFADGVVVVPKGTVAEIDSNNTVTIYNNSTNISKDDIFAIYLGDVPSVFIAKEVTTSGSATVIKTKEADFEEAVEDIDAEGSTYVLDDYFEVADGVELIDEELEDVEETQPIQMFSDKSRLSTASLKDVLSTKSSGTKKVKSKKLNINLNLGNLSVKGWCELSNLSCEYNLSTSKNKYSIALSGNANVHATVTHSNLLNIVGGSTSLTLGSYSIPGVGSVGVTLSISVEGVLTIDYSTGFYAGVECSKGQFRASKNFTKKNFTITGSVTFDISARASASVNVLSLNLLKGSIYYTIGAKIRANFQHYTDGKAPTDCVTTTSWLYINYGYNVSIGFSKWKWSDSKSWDIFNEYNSPARTQYHYEDKKQVTKCSRTGKNIYTTAYNSRYGSSAYGDGTYGFDSNGNQVTIYEYELNDDNLATITKYNGNASYLIIPDTLDGYTVAEIGSSVFQNNNYLKSVTIPDTVTKINSSAFYNCTNLSEVVIPDSVTSIGSDAFYNTNLSSITLPKSSTLGNGAFSNCKSLSSVYIPKETTMGESVFSGCTSLKYAKLPDTCQNIEDYTFYNCSSLTSVDFTDSVTNIQEGAFEGCTSLESINLSANLATIGNYAFYNSGLKNVSIPKKVTNIGSHAFHNCPELTTVSISSRVKSIGSYAFQNCEKLADVNIADYSIKKIDSSTFKDDPSLERIILPKGLTTISSQAFVNDTGLTEITIPETVTSIADDAFSYLNKITVYGYTDSYAKTYCDSKGIKFVDNHVLSEGITLSEEFNKDNDNFTIEVGEVLEVKFDVYPLNSNDCITLTSDNTKVAIDGMNITGKSAGDSVITATATSGVTYSFNIHVRYVKSITLNSLPTKTTYVSGEAFDPTGLEVQVDYSDETTALTTNYTISGYDAETTGNQTITVKYTALSGSTYSKTFTIEVVDPRGHLVGISITKLPNKVKYAKYESLDTTGLVVVAEYDTGKQYEITDYTVSGFNTLKTGEQVITVTKGDYTATFTVTVYDKEVPTDPNESSTPTTPTASSSATTPSESTNPTESVTSTEPYESSSSTAPSESTTVTEPSATTNPTENTTATEPTETSPKPAKTTVNLKKSSATVYVKATAQIKATVKNGKGKTTYKTSNKKVVKVNSSGKVTGVKKGTATITVTNNGVSKKFKITVKNPKLNKSKLTLKKEKSFKLSIKGKVGKAKFTSSNKKVATVSKKGNIKAKKKGKATITVKTNGIKLKCKITVR